MSVLTIISIVIMPLTISAILICGAIKHVPLFDCFATGAKEGLEVLIRILPTLVGIVVAINMLRASGLLEAITGVVSPILGKIGFPSDLLPLALMRPISGSGSIGLVDDLFKTHGPDSYVGRVSSVMLAAMETTFYVTAVYFGSIGISKTRYTIKAALIADLAVILASVYIVKAFFGY